MVVSKIHRDSLASMGEEAVVEYDVLANRLRNSPLMRDMDPLEAEHGSTACDKAGACVVHTHVHWLPDMGRFLNDFRHRLTVRNELFITQMLPGPPAYLFLRNSNGSVILDGQGLPSQTIRRILCDLLDRDDMTGHSLPD